MADELEFLRKSAAAINLRMIRRAKDIFEIGKILLDVKERLGHGNWMAWLDQEFGMSKSTAENIMRATREFHWQKNKVENISVAALYELSRRSAKKETVDEILRRSECGERIELSDVRRVAALHKAAT